MSDADRMQGDGADDALDAVFAAMRRDAPDAQAGLLARVLSDAEDQQDRMAEQARAAAARVAALRPPEGIASSSGGGFGSVVSGLGGWGGLGGMLTATVAGVWIGLTGSLPTIANAASWIAGDSAAAVELLPGSTDFTTALVPEDEG